MKFIILFFPLFSFSSINFDLETREKVISENINSLLEVETRVLKNMRNYIDLLTSAACASASESLQIDCLISEVKRSCYEMRRKVKKSICARFSDVLISNKLSEKYMISKSEKYKMLKKNKSYQSALENKRHFISSSLMTKFFLSKQFDCENKKVNSSCYARAIDQYCFKLGSSESISWNHCVSHLSWGVGFYNKE